MMTCNRTLSLLLAGGMALSAVPAVARDYILAPARPNKLVVVDTQAMAIDKVITLAEDAGPQPAVPVVDDEGRFAYVTINRTESIVKVDLTTGETVARTDFSSAGERVKTLFGMDLSPDGSTLAVYQSPVTLGTTHYEVQPTRIAFVDTATLETVKTVEAPRQITLLMYSADGSRIYGMGRSMFVFDAASGDQIDEMPIHGWKPDAYMQPDVLDVWSQFESSNIMVTPFYTARTDLSLDDPEAWRTGMLTLDLESGEMEMQDIRMMDVFYFSSAASPDGTRVYGAYNVLESFDMEKVEPLKRVALPHSYYSVNVSSDGNTVWLGGALSDLAAYDAETLERKGQVDMPDGAAMSLSNIRLFQRDE
ncbi:MAG: quinohemoprotein amine dehydrogenase subunit beta [Yangia sp.]|nr:quinohemoprotein amine dehydrogenase subunit beta [Salipiger sp.]